MRSAGPDDLPGLLDLYQHLTPGDGRPDPQSAKAILDLLPRYPGSRILIGCRGAVPVTTCTLIVVPNLTRGGAPYGLIENVVTHAGHRGQGLGQRILQAATEAAWVAGCYKLMLLTGSERPETLRFYQAAGFAASKTGFQKRRLPARAEV